MGNRLARETDTLRLMIEIFCSERHGGDKLCPACTQLLSYAQKRTQACRFGKDKPACSACPVHCYKPEMREMIREVMRHSGPRMMSRHPVLALRHLMDKHRPLPKVGSKKAPDTESRKD